jgi:hypothetical protein
VPQDAKSKQAEDGKSPRAERHPPKSNKRDPSHQGTAADKRGILQNAIELPFYGHVASLYPAPRVVKIDSVKA